MHKTRLVKLIDKIIGTLAVGCVARPLPAKTPKILRSILFIRPGGIGDAVLLIPAIDALKRKFPDAVITILAEKRNSSVFNLSPFMNKVLLYDKPLGLLKAVQGSYDVVIDTEQWHRLSAVIARLTRAPFSVGYATNERKRLFNHPVPYSHDDYEADSIKNLLGPLDIAGNEEIGSLFLVVPLVAREKAETLLGTLAEKSFITIFPGASIPERRWGAAKFAAVAQRLSTKGFPTVVVGGRLDERDGEKIVAEQAGMNLAGKTSLAETAAVIEKSSLLLSGDSGILHIGVGLGKSTVSLFGPGIARKWAPRGDRHIVINKFLPCSPCTKFGYTPKCPINAKCMADITVDEVVAAVEKLIMMGKANG